MNTAYRKPLPGTDLDYFDTAAAVNDIESGAWDRLPYTARVHAENIVRRADPGIVRECLEQIVAVKRERDFPWYPARVVCHDILGQTALVDLAGLRDAIAEQGGDPQVDGRLAEEGEGPSHGRPRPGSCRRPARVGQQVGRQGRAARSLGRSP